MDELYMGTEKPQTELETEPDALRDEPVGQTETVSDAPSTEDDMDPESAAAGSHQSGAQRRRERRVRPAPVVSIDDRLGVETDADKARDAMLDLVESLKTRRILSGTVQGIERPGDGANSVAVVYHGDFKVLIPAEEMVEKPEETRGRSVSDALHYMSCPVSVLRRLHRPWSRNPPRRLRANKPKLNQLRHRQTQLHRRRMKP